MSRAVPLVFGLFASLAMLLVVVSVATRGAVDASLAAAVMWVGALVAVGLGFVLLVTATR
ncbi:hypothetical protein [Halorussus sp. AFM4]|uniref:hypothetical protein n=1 Tax=Halorussus sp. AFM4 TaxID=3421651 RepID=UPI003EBFE833